MPTVFKMSPELTDGQHWCIARTVSQLIEFVEMWCAEEGDEPGESFSVEVIEMTEAEIEAAPDL